MKPKALPILLALLFGTAGYFIGAGNKGETGTGAIAADQGSSSRRNAEQSEGGIASTASSRARSSAKDGSSSSNNTEKKLWTTGNPIDRLDQFVEINDPLERARAWTEFVDSLSADQFESVVKEFRDRGMNSSNISEYAMLLSGWAKVAPLDALDFANKNTQNPFAKQTILATWSQKDPAAAIQWAKDNYKGEGANPYMVGIIQGLAFQDTATAEKLLKEMPRSVERGEGLDALIPALLKQGTESARAWAAAISDEALRNGAIARIAEKTMDKDPSGTADWLIANPSEATQRNLDDAIYKLAKQDNSAAMSYFQGLPAGENRTNALRGLVNAMASENPQAAAALMDRHSADVNDRMVQQFVWHSFREDPQLAVSNISRLQNEDERNRMYSRSIEWWMNEDKDAAFQWMSKNQLPQSVVDRLNRAYQGMQKDNN